MTSGVSKISLSLLLACLAVILQESIAGVDKDTIKDEAETYFANQVPGLLGKKFKEAVSCKRFLEHFEAQNPVYCATNEGRLNVMSVCKEQVQVERDRRDLQDYAIKYFNDPEETAVATCEEFADDFVSEYTSFKGEKGEAEAYCWHFQDKGTMENLRKIQAEHKEKTRTMDEAVKTAKEIHAEHVVRPEGEGLPEGEGEGDL